MTSLYVYPDYWLSGYTDTEISEYYVYPIYWTVGYAEGDPDSSSRDYEPYGPNAQSLTEVLIDLKNTVAGRSYSAITGFRCVALETIAQGQAVYIRNTDGKAGLAVANDTFDKANVAGFARTSRITGEVLDVIVTGVISTIGLDPGDLYYLSTSAGSISTTPPSIAGQYLVRVGEAANSTQLTVNVEPPIQLK
jgi:hypothetical protein